MSEDQKPPLTKKRRMRRSRYTGIMNEGVQDI